MMDPISWLQATNIFNKSEPVPTSGSSRAGNERQTSIPEELVKFASGKAKDVWGIVGNVSIVYYTPRTSKIIDFVRRLLGLKGSKEAEIVKEVKTAKLMYRELFKKHLISVIKEFSITNDKKEIKKLLEITFKNYKNVKGLLDESRMDDIREPHLKNLVGKIKELENSHPIFHIGDHVQLDLKVLKEKVNNLYTVEAEYAVDDLEKTIQRKEDQSERKKVLTIENRIDFGLQFLKGMEEMHAVNHVHGDLKPENVLVYEGNKVKNSDFGKTRKVSAKKAKMYSGNSRFVSPEWKLSQKAEVFSSALILIRMFEESFLKDEKTMLLEIQEEDKGVIKKVGKKKMRGIEQYLVLHKHAPQTDVSTTKGKLIGVAHSLGIIKERNPKRAVQVVHRYIDQLILELKETYPDEAEKYSNLAELLKHMTTANPKKRLSIEDARKRYEAIFATGK